MSISQGYPVNPERSGYPSSRYFGHGASQPGPPSGYREDYPQHHHRREPPSSAMNYDPDSGPGYHPSTMNPYQEMGAGTPYGYSPAPYDDGRFQFPAYHPGLAGAMGGGLPRGHPDSAIMGRVGYGPPLPWYGASPRPYPIPPEHMYNMYHYGR